MPGPKSFKATLERMQSALNWVVVRVPFDVSKVWGLRGQVKVKGDINGFAFRTSLFSKGDGRHVLLVNKRMQAGAKAAIGESAMFRLEPDTEPRVAAIPPELLRTLSEERALLRWFNNLNYSTRTDIGHWIADVKSPEARLRRTNQMAERLMSVMEAEKDLPPAIRMALARDARAVEGWKRMSDSRRRHHLFGIFYYREPAAQQRRIAKVVQEAVAVAEKAAKKAPATEE